MRALLITGGAIAALVVLVVLIGYSLPVTHRGAGEATINATPDDVFALITNVEGFSTWRPGVKSTERLPPANGRARFREVSGDGTISYVVDSVEPGRGIVTRIDDKTLPFGGTWTYALEPAGGGHTTLRITEDGEIYNPIFRFVSRFFIGYDATIKRYLGDVQRRFPN